MSESKREQKSSWAKTPVANLLRYHSSGVYFARVRVAGKLIRQSLKTNVFSVAKIRLADLTQEQRKAAEASYATIADILRNINVNVASDTVFRFCHEVLDEPMTRRPSRRKVAPGKKCPFAGPPTPSNTQEGLSY